MLGQNLPHDSSHGHVSGESEFIDDRVFLQGELHVDVVYSTCAFGKIKAIDLEEARRVPGCVGLFTAQDLKHNLWGSIFHDQPLLAEKEVQFYGEPVVVVAAETRESLLQAKRLVQIDYEPMTPILEIDQAIEKKLFIGPQREIKKGDVDSALKNAPHTLQGVIRMKGQDHFYLESQCSVAYPKELGQIEVHSSSQHPTEVQHLVAEALGLKFHQVVCVVKRMGGAFGGKESQAAPFAVFASLVAHHTGRPARIVLTKDDDMIMTGKRNPFQNHYHVGFDSEGRILGLKAQLYSDGGAYADLSTAIMERAMLHSDNAYFLPTAYISGVVCKTHTPPNTAFRGFGGPKGVLMIENVMEEIAQKLGKDSLEIRKLNCYGKQDRNVTHYGQVLEENHLPELFSDLEKKCHYEKRRREIESFNQTSSTEVRGLSMTAVKFGISFTTRFLNQGNALVNVHMDGTIQVSTGATEMGQGVNTKIAQVVADEFSIPIENVRVMATSTEKNHNTSPTAASSGSDINAAAASVASQKIIQRLKCLAIRVFERSAELRGRVVAGSGTAEEIRIDPESTSTDHIEFHQGEVIDRKNSKNRISFIDLISEAYLNRVSLGDYGFFRYEGIHYDKEKGQGNPFYYFTQGVAASEVSVNRFTGELKVLQTDILMDLGRPINEGIDRGQVVGGFVQGMGWATTEDLFYDSEGALVSHSPSTYKIPSIQDIPRSFQVEFFDNPHNRKNIKASKAVGEPPLLLAISVWTAAKNALRNIEPNQISHLSLPATQEELLSWIRNRKAT